MGDTYYEELCNSLQTPEAFRELATWLQSFYKPDVAIDGPSVCAAGTCGVSPTIAATPLQVTAEDKEFRELVAIRQRKMRGEFTPNHIAFLSQPFSRIWQRHAKNY